MAAFMAGVAANVTAFNTVVTYDLVQAYWQKDRDDRYYIRMGRLVTVGGILISIATAFIAKGYSNMMNYIQIEEPRVQLQRATGVHSDEDEIKATKAANRFDIRRIIGGVFLLYGLVLMLLGIFGSHEVKTKAAGINIDLWTGIGMLIFAGLMIFWALARPVQPEPAEIRARGPAGSAARRQHRAYASVALTVTSTPPSARETGQFWPASPAAWAKPS